MFTHWEVNRAKLASRVLFQRPAYYLPEQILQQHVRERVFPDRKLRKRAPDIDVAAFDAKCNEVRRLAAMNEAENPVSFAIGNSWSDEQTNATTLNTLHGVRHSLLSSSSSTCSWVAPLDRCTGDLFSQVYVLSLVFSVLVCLSVDVTGALVLL